MTERALTNAWWVVRDRIVTARAIEELLADAVRRLDTGEVSRLLTAARAAAPRTPMWGGLMGYESEPALLRDQVAAVRDVGCEGAILFAYDPAQRDLLDAFAEA